MLEGAVVPPSAMCPTCSLVWSFFHLYTQQRCLAAPGRPHSQCPQQKGGRERRFVDVGLTQVQPSATPFWAPDRSCGWTEVRPFSLYGTGSGQTHSTFSLSPVDHLPFQPSSLITRPQGALGGGGVRDGRTWGRMEAPLPDPVGISTSILVLLWPLHSPHHYLCPGLSLLLPAEWQPS